MVVTVLFLSISLGSGIALANCSPGVPCPSLGLCTTNCTGTGYDIYDNNSAGISAAFNGPKTGTPAPHTNKTGATTSACDGNFMNQIYSRAYMEASREVIMSEQLIHKPDSVLEYTCFDQLVNIAAHNAGTAFSESTEWEDVDLNLWVGGDHGDGDPGDRPHTHGCDDTCPDKEPEDNYNVVFPDDRLDIRLEALLFPTLKNYIDNNYSHTFMGESINIDNTLSTGSIGSNSYLCSHMSTVWDISRCIDFGEDDRFRSFKHLVESDPRTIPQSCSPGHESDDTIEAGESTTKYENTNPGGGHFEKMPSDLEATTEIAGVDVGIDIDIDPEELCPPAGGVVSGVKTGFSNDIIRIANNCDSETDDDQINAYSSFDAMELYSYMIKGAGIYMPGIETPDDKTLPAGLSLPGIITCAFPIPTGIPVITYDISNSLSGGIDTINRSYQIHLEHICPNPGCYYQPIKSPYILGAPIPPIITGLCLPIL